MSVNEFNRLSEQDKVRVVLNKAALLASITYYGGKANLNALDVYFIEVRLNAISSDVEKLLWWRDATLTSL